VEASLTAEEFLEIVAEFEVLGFGRFGEGLLRFLPLSIRHEATSALPQEVLLGGLRFFLGLVLELALDLIESRQGFLSLLGLSKLELLLGVLLGGL
jgi:hypothetical protein